jgi:ferredoxin-NADP reductase
MEPYIVRILSIQPVTHNVKRFRLEKPAGYTFHPGQATDLSINTDVLKAEKRPFTFTCLQEEDYLEFTIKIYESHHGVTDALGKLTAGDEVIISDSWGAIEYKGPGTFLAGGAGITPFIAIFRRLYKDNNIAGNQLIFSNKKLEDIILREEFTTMLGDKFINVITGENVKGFEHRHLDAAYIKEKITDFKQPFYICGPDLFVSQVTDTLMSFGASPESVVFEK